MTKVRITENDGSIWEAATPVTPTPVPTITVDKNGIAYVQPLTSDGYKLTYSNESFTFNKNFRSDGSMRCDFVGVRNSVFIAGYFKVQGTDTGEEISAKLNGGTHNDTNPEYADTMDMGITNFLGTNSRVRWEKTHPIYSDSIPPTYSQLPVGDVRNKWVGAAGLKINLDTTGDGQPDKVALIGMIDPSGLDANGKPVNNWRITFKRIFSPSEIDLKSIFTPYVATIGHPELAQTTMRIDQQNQSAWLSSTPPYKFVTCKELVAIKG